MRIVFAGDSITDVGRNRLDTNRADSLGSGYPVLSAASIMYSHPGKSIEFFNSAKSGNTIAELLAHWKDETLGFNPDILVLLIGINDIWHSERASGADPDIFENIYRMLLQLSYKKNPELKVVLLEPFWEGMVENRPDLPGKKEWGEQLDVMRDRIRRIALDFPVSKVINTQSLFDEANKATGPLYWTLDTVHPSSCGHMLISKELCRVLEELL